MRCLVTGAAGFIGSNLCDQLLDLGHEVVGLDAFIPYYPREIKQNNLITLKTRSNFTFHELDLREDNLADATNNVSVVFHLAAMAGLVLSWKNFNLYSSCNLLATQRLLDSLRNTESLKKFIYVSTSSVYGKFSSGDESMPTKPSSPYGVTKLASENLCHAFREEFNLPLSVLRYFSVYGPRQRPDMGYNIFIKAMLNGETITVYGDGQQSRGNTYVSDCVNATIAAINSPDGETYNIGGGEIASVWEIIERLEKITGCKAKVKLEQARAGDQRSTGADISKAVRDFGWQPQVSLEEGLTRQVAWQKSLLVRKAA